MGSIFSWASPQYMLDHMTLSEIYMYHDYGIEFEENKANILTSRIAVGLFGANEPQKPKTAKQSNYKEKPDKEAFYKRYGDRIKRPDDEIGG